MKLFTTLAALGLGAAFGAKTTELADKVADVKAQLPSVDLGVIAPTGESADMLAQLDEFVRSRWDASSAKPEAFFGSVREFLAENEPLMITKREPAGAIMGGSVESVLSETAEGNKRQLWRRYGYGYHRPYYGRYYGHGYRRHYPYSYGYGGYY
jgi:hypothetical protein